VLNGFVLRQLPELIERSHQQLYAHDAESPAVQLHTTPALTRVT
jgi:hypothetical protein